MTHYHVMYRSGFKNSPESLGGDIFTSLTDAALYLTYLLGRSGKYDHFVFTSLATYCHKRGVILRTHRRKRRPYIWLAICTLDTCNVDQAHVEGIASSEGFLFMYLTKPPED